MKRFWISWVQKSSDFRPLTDPPNAAILGWWCSGYQYRGESEDAILCAAVDAPSQGAAEQAVLKDWPEAAGEWRFCEERSRDWQPGDRFPITKQWEKERFGIKA